MSNTSLIPASKHPQYHYLAPCGRAQPDIGSEWESDCVPDLAVRIWARRERGREVLKQLLDFQNRPNQRYPRAHGSDALALLANKHPTSMRVAASNDQLQLQLVDLCWLLDQANDEARRLAALSQAYFWSSAATKLVYGLTAAPSMSGLAIPAILWVCIGITSTYGAYRAILLSLVHLCRRRATRLKHKLDTEQVTQKDRSSLSGWAWDWIGVALH